MFNKMLVIVFIIEFSRTSDPLVKVNSTYDRVNLVAPASPIKCLPYLPNVWAIQYKLGPERLTRLGNSNVLRLPVFYSGYGLGSQKPSLSIFAHF